MIRGEVTRNADSGLEPWITVSVEDASGEFRQFEVILDTGFTGWLMLPASAIGSLGLTRRGDHAAIIAGGTSDRFDYYVTRALRHERLVHVEIFQSIDQSLLGTALLEGSRVTVDTWEGGDVIIEEVPTGPSEQVRQ